MKPYLQRLVDVDDKIDEAETGLNMYLGWMANNSPIPKTVQHFIGTLNHISRIKSTMYDFANCDDMLCGKIVYRTFLEQYLRFLYLLVRSFRTGGDSVVSRYEDALFIMEDFACKRADSLALKYYHDKEISTADMWPALLTKRPDFAKYKLPEVDQMLHEFSWDSITRYLETSKEKEGPGEPSNHIFEHAWTLCFIQGGPGLRDALELYKSREELENEFERMCTSALEICTAVKMHICYFFGNYNKDFDVLFNRIRAVAPKIQEGYGQRSGS